MKRSQPFGLLAAIVGFATLGLAASRSVADDEPIFSGPQVGERLPAFVVRGVFDDVAGKELDFVTAAEGRPIVLIFVHDVNRQSIGMTRTLSQYTAGRADEGLATGVVWLDDDLTAAENQLKRMRHALAPDAPIGLSVDGREGPGSYGLNRNVMLTILVGAEGKVTGNFALVQPSLQVDLPIILRSIVETAGGEMPKLEELAGMPPMARAGSPAPEPPNLRPLLAPLIRRDASDAAVERAAAAIAAAAERDPAIRREIGRITNTIIDADKLENYGTPKAQGYLRQWATAYGRPAAEPTDTREPARGESPPKTPSPPEGR